MQSTADNLRRLDTYGVQGSPCIRTSYEVNAVVSPIRPIRVLPAWYVVVVLLCRQRSQIITCPGSPERSNIERVRANSNSYPKARRYGCRHGSSFSSRLTYSVLRVQHVLCTIHRVLLPLARGKATDAWECQIIERVGWQHGMGSIGVKFVVKFVAD